MTEDTLGRLKTACKKAEERPRHLEVIMTELGYLKNQLTAVQDDINNLKNIGQQPSRPGSAPLHPQLSSLPQLFLHTPASISSLHQNPVMAPGQHPHSLQLSSLLQLILIGLLMLPLNQTQGSIQLQTHLQQSPKSPLNVTRNPL